MKLVVGLLTAMASANIYAEQQAYSFAADISAINLYDAASQTTSDIQSYSPDGFSVGQTLFGRFIYDNEYDKNPDPNFPPGYLILQSNHTVSIENKSGFSFASSNVNSYATFTLDDTPSVTFATHDPGGSFIDETNIVFSPKDPTDFLAFDLPNRPSLDEYSSIKFAYYRTDVVTTDAVRVYANFTSLIAAPVPEVPAWALMMSGLLFVGGLNGCLARRRFSK
jgi:hypothetical protein